MYVLKSQLNIGYWLGLHVAGWSLTGTCLEFAVGLTINVISYFLLEAYSSLGLLCVSNLQ